MTRASWLIGSTAIAAQTVTVDGSGESIAAGEYYLYDGSAPSLTAQMVAAMTSAGVADPVAVLLKNRRLRLASSGTFTVTWPADGILRDLLGFTTNLAGNTSYDATNPSPLLWSPGTTENPTSPIGLVGRTVYNTRIGVGDDGRPCATTHGSRVVNGFYWRNVALARYQTSSALGGEYQTFAGQVLVRQAAFKLWRNVDEDDSSSTAVTLSSSLGPYAMTPQGRSPDADGEREAGFELADARWRVGFDAYVRTEVSN